MSNDFETAARAKKAAALVDGVELLCRKCEIDTFENAEQVAQMLSTWSERQRNELAVSCGQRPPSDTTWDLVVARFFARAEMVKQRRAG